MTGRTTMNISLPEAMRAWVDARVQTGEFANASDYVRDLIRHDQAQSKDSIDAQAIPDIRNGIANIKAGRITPADAVFQRLERKYGAQSD